MIDDIYSQSPLRCKFDWAAAGALMAAERGDIVVLVDTLSFSTAVACAVDRGAVIYPCREDQDVPSLAAEYAAEVAVARKDVPHLGRYSLSPLTFGDIEQDTRVILPSLNGGTCARCSDSAPHLIAGALVNASDVAVAVNSLMKGSGLAVSVIACGEHERERPGVVRFAIEDYLGAGAILAQLPFSASPEARVCRSAFLNNQAVIGHLIWNSVSGRELRLEGFGADVELASRLDSLDAVPVLRNGAFRRF